MREIPVPGDRQEVITKDNVVVTVNATIFTQIVDAKQALFSVSNFNVAIDALARTALRSVIGTLSLDESLSERERINTDVQSQMEAVTDKWGIRIARIEIMEITPPPKILEALALRSRPIRRSGRGSSSPRACSSRRSTSPTAKQRRRSVPPRVSGRPRSCGRRASAGVHPRSRRPGSSDHERVHGDHSANPDPTLVAILQLETLSKFADSDNTKVVVPYESAALLRSLRRR